eukprot:scaffold13789_cov123-Isochrysis_galbana.AAC.1
MRLWRRHLVSVWADSPPAGATEIDPGSARARAGGTEEGGGDQLRVAEAAARAVAARLPAHSYAPPPHSLVWFATGVRRPRPPQRRPSGQHGDWSGGTIAKSVHKNCAALRGPKHKHTQPVWGCPPFGARCPHAVDNRQLPADGVCGCAVRARVDVACSVQRAQPRGGSLAAGQPRHNVHKVCLRLRRRVACGRGGAAARWRWRWRRQAAGAGGCGGEGGGELDIDVGPTACRFRPAAG